MTESNENVLSVKTQLRQIPTLQAPLPVLDVTAMPETPQEAFALWLTSALEAGVREPHAMTLSTVDESGWPDARVLILKNVDERGWHFAIKRGSPKARQLDHQERVALTFYWPVLGRQIRLRGVAVALSAQECAEDYLSRPLSSRISAMASKQSEAMEQPAMLQQRLDAARIFLEKHPNYVEPDWRVYAVRPSVVEFWQGATDRNHQRWCYTPTLDGSGWQTALLWP